MRFLVIILLFIFAVIGSVALAKLSLRGNLETEMERRALVVLSGAGYEGVEVKFDHFNAGLAGFVENPEDISKLIGLLKRELPAAYWPGETETTISIRPTLLPLVVVTRAPGSDLVKIEGVLAPSDEEARSLLASRLHALPGIAGVENLIGFDPRQISFPEMAEFASLASGLFAHSGEAEVSFKDGHLTMNGTVPNRGIRAGLLELAESIAPGNIVDQIAVKTPDTFLRSTEIKLTRNRFGVTLSGVLSEEADRAVLLGALRGAVDPSVSIIDRIEMVKDRARAPWLGSLPIVFPALLKGLTGEMTAEFTGSRIRLRGTSPDEETFRTMEAGLSQLAETEPAIAIIADITIAPPGRSEGDGQRFLAVYEGELLIFSGKLSDEMLPGRLEERLVAMFPQLTVKNEIEVVPASPGDEWVARLPEFFSEALRRVERGTFRSEENRFVMEGVTRALSDRQIMQNIAVNTVPANFTIQNDLLHVDTPAPKTPLTPPLRDTLSAALKESPLYFDMGSEILGSDERAKISALVETLKKANVALSLVVTGVADNLGNAEKNRELSLRRADAVVAELERLGLEVSAIETAATVENVSNLRPGQRWRARRVDISLKPPAEEAPVPVP
jgi:outer membrane protein OmpA-like peptidoglycan-associated protein